MEMTTRYLSENVERIHENRVQRENMPETVGVSIKRISSGNQTWQWQMDHLSMIFLLKPPFRGDFPLLCLMTKG